MQQVGGNAQRGSELADGYAAFQLSDGFGFELGAVATVAAALRGLGGLLCFHRTENLQSFCVPSQKTISEWAPGMLTLTSHPRRLQKGKKPHKK